MRHITVGSLIIGIGIIHNGIGIILGFEHLVDILTAGAFNTITDDLPWRMAIFWFLWFGWLLMLLGATVRWAENSGLRLPGWLALAFAALALSGAFFMPASGFWTLLPVAALAWRRRGNGSPSRVVQIHNLRQKTG